MSAKIVKFPVRHRGIIVVEREHDADGGWLVIRGNHGWLHGDVLSAFLEARELAAVDSVAITFTAQP